MNCQVTGYTILFVIDVFDSGTFEVKCRILFHVQKIWRLEMPITHFILRVYACGVHLSLNPRILRMLLVDMYLAIEHIELPSYRVNHHIFSRKGGFRVARD